MVTSYHVCEICTLQASKYQCPKCHLKYCSLNCYKLNLRNSSSSSAEANQFYKIHENCLRILEKSKEEDFKILLKSLNNKSNKNDVEKMQSILLKDSMSRQKEVSIEDDEDLDHNFIADENDSIANENDSIVSENDSIASEELDHVLKKMSLEEKQNFYRFCERFSQAGIHNSSKKDELFELVKEKTLDLKNVGPKLKLWEPWWLRENISFALIQDLDDSNNINLPIIHVIPMKSTKSVNPKLKYHIVDILLAYICSCKILNGELLNDLPEMMSTFSYIISSSVNLSYKVGGEARCKSVKADQSSFLYETATEVVQIFKQRLISSGYCQKKDAILMFLNDVFTY